VRLLLLASPLLFACGTVPPLHPPPLELVPDGPVVLLHESGAVAQVGYYRDGRREGRWVWLDEEGNLVAATRYYRNLPIGESLEWDERGQPRVTGISDDGERRDNPIDRLARDIAGPDAVDCGVLASGTGQPADESPAAALACAHEALTAGRPFTLHISKVDSCRNCGSYTTVLAGRGEFAVALRYAYFGPYHHAAPAGSDFPYAGAPLERLHCAVSDYNGDWLACHDGLDYDLVYLPRVASTAAN
jgi:hypothetical protein